MLLIDEAKNILNKDPAAKNLFEVIICYPSLYAIVMYHIAHKLYLKKRYILANMISKKARRKTGIESEWTFYRSWNGSSNRRNCRSGE